MRMFTYCTLSVIILPHIFMYIWLSHNKFKLVVFKDYDCVRRHNFNAGILMISRMIFNLCMLIKSTFFRQQLGFLKKIFQWHWSKRSRYKLRCVTAPVSVDSRVRGLKYLHQPSNSMLNILTLTGNVEGWKLICTKYIFTDIVLSRKLKYKQTFVRLIPWPDL